MRTQILFYPGCSYHVYNRSNGRELMFRNETDYQMFLDNYNKYMHSFWYTHAYCLMPTHFHFVITMKKRAEIEVTSANLASKAFSNFANGYAQRFNYRYQRHGSLFSQNVRRLHVCDQLYMKRLIAYVHRNPVQSGLVAKPEDWKHCSFNEISLNDDSLLGPHPVYNIYESRKEFQEFHNINLGSEEFKIAYRQAG